MNNPFINETAVIINHVDGTRTVTSGEVAILAQTASEFGAVESRTGRQAWLPAPANRRPAQSLEFCDPLTGVRGNYWVIFEQRERDYFDLVRYSLQEPGEHQ